MRKSWFALMILLTACANGAQQYVATEGRCWQPAGPTFNGPYVTYGIAARDGTTITLQRCEWWWYGGLATGENHLTKRNLIRVDSSAVVQARW